MFTKNKLYLCDCMDFMAFLPDKSIDWIIADPPYFKGPEESNYYGEYVSKTGVARTQYDTIECWDVPGLDWYEEILRVSKNQIIWGINYFEFSNKVHGRLVWNKGNYFSSFSKAELASCSKINTVQTYDYLWNGMIQQDMKNREKRIHQTQKPVGLVKLILNDYCKKGELIMDTHAGSCSTAIACDDLGLDWVCIEKSPSVYKKGEERIRKETAQGKLFEHKIEASVTQLCIAGG